MAWTPLAKPYGKYIYEDPNDYTSSDPELVKQALAGAGLDGSTDGLFTNYSNMMGLVSGAAPTPNAAAAPNKPAVNFRQLIENDPLYIQAQADLSAQGISDASQRAAALRRTLIDWGVIPDFAGAADKLGLSANALGYISSDVDPRTREFAAQNEAEGLSRHARIAKANEDNIAAIRNALAARGMYQSGELGYGLEDNARQYKQAATDAEKQVLGTVEDISSRYSSSQAERQRQLAGARTDAAGRVLQQVGSSDLSGTQTAKPVGGVVIGKSTFVLPAKTAAVWDVNTASTYDAINAARQSGGSIVVRPDDPEAIVKANGAAQAGVPVSIQVNGVGDDTPATLAARVQQYQQQFPGASFTLDLESPNFRDMTPGAMEAYAQAVNAVAGNTPIVITTEGVSDFNYGAWASNPNVIFAPQAYWGDMTPRDVSQVVSLLTSQGIPPERIIPVVAPGQDLGSYTGPVSVYGASPNQSLQTQTPTPAATAPTYAASAPVAAAQQNAVQSAGNYSPETVQQILAAVSQAYNNPVMDPTLRPGGRY